jgi:hypothetical protein
MTDIERDPDYDFVPPLPEQKEIPRPKGRQCGECGMKFEYGKAYGFSCGNTRCPTGWNMRTHGL